MLINGDQWARVSCKFKTFSVSHLFSVPCRTPDASGLSSRCLGSCSALQMQMQMRTDLLLLHDSRALLSPRGRSTRTECAAVAVAVSSKSRVRRRRRSSIEARNLAPQHELSCTRANLMSRRTNFLPKEKEKNSEARRQGRPVRLLSSVNNQYFRFAACLHCTRR